MIALFCARLAVLQAAAQKADFTALRAVQKTSRSIFEIMLLIVVSCGFALMVRFVSVITHLMALVPRCISLRYFALILVVFYSSFVDLQEKIHKQTLSSFPYEYSLEQTSMSQFVCRQQVQLEVGVSSRSYPKQELQKLYSTLIVTVVTGP